jgi:hypothetical protein
MGKILSIFETARIETTRQERPRTPPRASRSTLQPAGLKAGSHRQEDRLTVQLTRFKAIVPQVSKLDRNVPVVNSLEVSPVWV